MPGGLKPPIILFGNFRSGTTLLQRVISQHPEVVEFYEPAGLWKYADPTREHHEFDAADATPKVKAYIRDRFLKYQQENGDRIIVEKTPHNILRAPYVREIFPEAHYIYIIRNPLSFVSSVELKWQKPAGAKRIMKRVRSTPVTQLHHYFSRFLQQQWRTKILRRKYLSVWGPRYRGIQEDVRNEELLTVIARQWARAAAKADRDLDKFEKGQVLKLKYEELVADPVAELKVICRHCGLEMTEGMAQYALSHVRADRQDKWRRLDPQQLARIIPEIAEQMAHSGYDVPEDIARLAP